MLDEEIRRSMAPMRQLLQARDLMKSYSVGFHGEELLGRFDQSRQLREMIDQTSLLRQGHEMLGSEFVASSARRRMEQLSSKGMLASGDEALRRLLTTDLVGQATKELERSLMAVAGQQAWLGLLRGESIGGTSALDIAKQIQLTNPTFAAMEAAKKSLDSLLGSLKDIDFSTFEPDEDNEQEAKEAALSITQAANTEPTLQAWANNAVAAIQAEPNPAVQLMLWVMVRKVLDWLIAGAIGAVMGYYAPAVLGQSPQAATKTVKEIARETVGDPELLQEYRYVSSKMLIVRQNPKARSPEIGRLTFGQAVKLIKKDKDFALILWTDRESEGELQGWVFARHLRRFN